MTTRPLWLPTLTRAALALALIAATAPAAAADRRAVPREGDAPQTRVESRSSSSSSSGAARARPSSSSSRGGSSSASGSSAVSRTRPTASSGGSSDAPTRVDRNPDRYRGFHRPHRHHYPYYGYPYYGSHFYFGYHTPFYYWPWAYWGAVPVYYPSYRGGGYSGGGHGEEVGALDLDVRPEKAEVWVDGQRLGVADNFDGFPTYLWLPEGTYDVVLFKEGYESIHRQYSIYPGVVVDVEDRMVPGDSVRPEDLVAPKTTERRDERLRRNAERRSQAEAGAAAPRGSYDTGAYDARGEPGRLRLRIRPEDASIYLDGRFLGTASELADLHAGLIVDPGEHRLEVVRPGYDSNEVEFEVGGGEEVTVEVTLEAGAET